MDTIELMQKAFSEKYFLDGKEPKLAVTREDFQQFLDNFSSDSNTVKRTYLRGVLSGKVKKGWGKGAKRRVRVTRGEVSTVFVQTVTGIPNQFMFFETMIFEANGDKVIHRYKTWDKAELHHNEIVAERAF